MMASFGAWKLESNGYHETEDRDGLCVSICTAIGSLISAVFSRTKVVRSMTNNTSWYRLVNVN